MAGRMASDSRSTHKSKDDECSSSRRLVNGEGSSTYRTTDSSGLRRSTRGIPSRTQMTSGPSQNTRKSERLEKRTPSTSPVLKKRHERQIVPSPLRRSDRGKKQASSSSSGSKRCENRSDFLDDSKKSLKQLAVEVREHGKGQKDDQKSTDRKRKRMDARSYKSLFKLQRRRNNAPDSDDPETLIDAERESVDDTAFDKLRPIELEVSLSAKRSLDGDLEKCEIAMQSNKRDSMDVDTNASAVVAGKEVFTCTVDSISSKLTGCIGHNVIETSIARSETQRGDFEHGVAARCDDGCSTVTLSEEIPVDFGEENVCALCKLGGKLLCCEGEGCKKSYHLSCLDPPLDDVPPGVWHCSLCVRKKIELGILSVSKGVESIWDVREVEVPDSEGSRKQRQYLVKYEGLAHVHNQWVPEALLLVEAPFHVTKFKQNNQVVKWKDEWKIPQRLLKRRPLTFSNQYEWLVKWCGLDYEHATWELDISSFLNTPEGQSLIKKYESRHEKAKRAAFSVNKSEKQSPVKLSNNLSGGSLVINNSHLESVSKLCEYWAKGKNAVLIDDKERMMKMILFILSLSEVCQPFLLITTSRSLALWEAEFLRLAPSLDVILYSGNRGTRRSIRTLEFYEESGCIMLQVLLSPPEAVMEDLDTLGCIRWEAVIVDECQHPAIYNHFDQFKKLVTGVRMLLLNGQVKERVAEYLNLLSLLDSNGNMHDGDGLKSESHSNLSILKERFLQFIAYNGTSDLSRFIEYWVPVQISNVQLEQYCRTLLSNSISLCSCAKNDPVGALRDILIATRKCCDHPYILENSLQRLLIERFPTIPCLDLDIRASGKLQLLDMMLSEMKKQHRRVLILFQYIRISEKETLGDHLDDFMRLRFGSDSYERFDGGGVVPSRKQAALNRFNSKESGRFVFLLESRPRLPNIKLTSMDAIIIFDSDWNPVNDLRALHRISVDSQFEKIKIFRLYSSCTIEEKILILAKRNLTLDMNLQNISRSTSDPLLMWGASYLFNSLEEFHAGSDLVCHSNISSGQSLLDDVMKEFIGLISSNDNWSDENNSVILNACLIDGIYRTNFPLFGEKLFRSTQEDQPHVFWMKLFEGRNLHWRFSSLMTQRNRKRVQYIDESLKIPGGETDEVGKKRRKLAANCIGTTTPVTAANAEGNDESVTTGTVHALKPSISSNNIVVPDVWVADSEQRPEPDNQKSLQHLLKPEISKLIQVLELPEDAKVMVWRFLEYVIKNHHVNRDPTTILQAFQLSLCWVAASSVKHKIDRKESLARAKQHLNFSCKEEEANHVYSKLRSLKKMLSSHADNIANSESSRDNIPLSEHNTKLQLDERMSQLTALNSESLNVEAEERLQNSEFSDEIICSHPEEALTQELAGKEVEKCNQEVERKCRRRMTNLIRKQQQESQEFHKIWEDKRVQLDKKHKLETALVRSMYSNISVRVDRLKDLENGFAKKLEEHGCLKDTALKDLHAKQLAERNDETQKTAYWLEKLHSCCDEDRAFNERSKHKPESGNDVENQLPTYHSPWNGPEDNPLSGHLVEVRGHDRMDSVQPSEAAPVHITETAQNDRDSTSSPHDTRITAECPQHENAFETLVSKMTSSAGTGSKQPNRVECSVDLSNDISSASPPREQIPEGSVSGDLGGEGVLVASDASTETAVRGSNTIESDAKNGNAISSYLVFSVRDQNDVIDVSSNVDISSTDLSMVDMPAIVPAVSPGHDGVLPQNLENQDCSPSLAPTEVQEGDIAVQRNEEPLQQVECSQPVDARPNDQSNNEAMSIENDEQVQPSPSIQSPLRHNLQNEGLLQEAECSQPVGTGPNNQSNNEARPIENDEQVQPSPYIRSPRRHNQSGVALDRSQALQPDSEEDALPLNVERPPSLVEDSAQLLDEAVLQTGENFQHRASNASDLRLDSNLDLGSRSRVDHEAPTQTVFHTANLQNRAVMQPGVTLPAVQGSNIPMHIGSRASRMPRIAVYGDPLQIELDRIRRETEQAVKMHEDMKLQLKSDCDKEIEEMVSQIRGKYEAKLRDVEKAFFHKKNELDENHNKVLMNKILAEAFRSKCLDLRSSGSLGMQQFGSSSYAQQPRQSQLQLTRPYAVAGAHLVAQPTASMQTTAPGLQVHHSALVSPGNVVRPPHISPITPSTGNIRLGGEIRAPAPHLQPFRPTASLSSANLPSLLRGQQALSNLPVSCSLLPQLPLQPSISRPPNHQQATNNQPTSVSLQIRSALPPFAPSGPCSRPPLLANTIGMTSLSALGLLMDFDNRVDANQINTSVSLPDLRSNLESLDLSEFGPSAGARVSSSPMDVVCLSDDD